MKTMRLATLLVALATPAWAFNDEKPTPYDGPVISGEQWKMALGICHRVGANLHICAMKNAPTEAQALETAKAVLDHCAKTPGEACDPATAYIKQRWGY